MYHAVDFLKIPIDVVLIDAGDDAQTFERAQNGGVLPEL